MSNILCPILWQPEDFILFRKCGEITISPDAQCLGFNCVFCSSTCLQADVLLQHIQDQHKDDVFNMYQVENSTLPHGELLQLHEVQIVNNEDLNLNWNNICLRQTTDIEYLLQDNSQRGNDEANASPEIVTVTSGPEDSTIYETSDLWMNTQVESLMENNSFEDICPPLGSPTSFTSYSPSSTSTSCGTSTDNDCEMGDGEDSGIVLVQTPCENVCTRIGTDGGGVRSGFSDCMSLNGDSSSKLQDISTDSWENPTTEDENTGDTTAEERHALDDFESKGKYVKTAAMRKALDSTEVISCLLELYKNNEKLWNPEHASYKYNARRTVYNELSKPLLQQINVHLSGLEIFGILNILRGRYRRELAKFQARKGKHRTRLWYFDKMSFLRTVIEEKRKVRLRDKDSCAATVQEPEDLTNRQILSFIISQYKNYECLWNPNDEDYGGCSQMEIYEEISDCLQKDLNIVVDDKEVENEIQKLRIRYRKELRILHKLKGLYIPKLWCFDELEFLRPVMEDKIIKNVEKNSNNLLPPSHSKKYFLNAKEIKFPGFEQQLQFIDVYRKYVALWDVDHPDYRSVNYRQKALQSMFEEVNSALQPIDISIEQMEKTLHQLRKDFSAEKLKRLSDKNHNDQHLSASLSSMSLMVYEKLSEFLSINIGPFRCENCRHICKTYDQYKIHKSKHDGTLPFICTLCGKGFQMPGNLTIHIRRHRQDFPYSCETCNKSFATSTEVTIHMRSHTGERPYICDLCGKTFKTWSFFNIHKRTHLNQSNFHCPICDKAFYERNRFTDHMNVHLNIRKHQCEQCGKAFTTISNLKKHQELHAPNKKYKCSLCGKCFAQFPSLRWHQKSQHQL